MEENNQVEEKANGWLVAVSILVPLVGLILFITLREEKPKTAKVSGICALVSFVVSLIIVPIIMFILASNTIMTVTGNEGLLEKSKQAKAQNEIAEAKEIVTINIQKGLTEYLEEKYSTVENKNIDISVYIMKELKNAKKEIADKNVSLSASGNKIFLSSDNYKVTGTVSDSGSVTWSNLEEK